MPPLNFLMTTDPEPGDRSTSPVLLFLAAAVSATWMFTTVLLHGV